jgi:ABC-type multidrug transport system fused ATPase/permease subunit
VGSVDALLDFWTFFLFGLAQQKLVKKLRVDVFGAMMAQDMGFFDAASTGDLTSRLTSDTAEMSADLTWVFRFTIEALVKYNRMRAHA